jgi:hypothetical protein
MATGRTFDGVDDFITLALGNCGVAFGAATVAAIIKRSALTGEDQDIIAGYQGAGATNFSWHFAIASEFFGTPNVIFLETSAGFSLGTGITVTPADGQILIACTKASGNVAPRFHKYSFSTETWTHSNGSVNLNNGAVTSNRLQLGLGAANGFFAGDILIAGFWNEVLDDAAIEALIPSLQAFEDSNPDGLWLLNQPNVADDVIDLTGGGADETAITGTTVGVDDFEDFVIVEEGGYWLQEDGVSRWLLEDGSGFWIMEGEFPSNPPVELDSRIFTGSFASGIASAARLITSRVSGIAPTQARSSVLRQINTRVSAQSSTTVRSRILRNLTASAIGSARAIGDLFVPIALNAVIAVGSSVKASVGAARRVSARVIGSVQSQGKARVEYRLSVHTAGRSSNTARTGIARTVQARISGNTQSRGSSSILRKISVSVRSTAATTARSSIARALSLRTSAQSLVLVSFEEVGVVLNSFISSTSRVIGSIRVNYQLKARVQSQSTVRAVSSVNRKFTASIAGKATTRAVQRVTRALTASISATALIQAQSRINYALFAVIHAASLVLGTLPTEFKEFVAIGSRFLRASMQAFGLRASLVNASIRTSITNPIISVSLNTPTVSASLLNRTLSTSINMVPTTANLRDYIIGDDTDIPFEFSNFPENIIVSKVYLTIKKSKNNLDAAAIIKREITITPTIQGTVTADGSDGIAAGFFKIRHEDPEWLVVKEGVAYQYDIQIISDQGTVLTPIVGVASFKKGVTDSQS